MRLTRRDAIEALLASAAVALTPSTLLAAPPATPSPPAEPPFEDGATDTANDRFDHLTAPVMVNGQGPFPFMVDTGANISCVSTKLVETLGLPVLAPRPVHTVVGVRSRPLAMIDELSVGTRTRRRLTALALPLDDAKLAGVLAVDWLQEQRLTLDFERNNLQFTRSRSEFSGPGQVVVPARRRHGQLTIVQAELGEAPISALIDSGSEASLCNSSLMRLLDRRSALPAKRQIINMVTVVGEPFAGELMYLPFLKLGGLQLGNVPVVHSDTHAFEIWGFADTPALLLGMDLLRQFRAVSLDFGRRQVRFDLSGV